MLRLIKGILMVLAGASLAFSMPAWPDGGSEADARAAFDKLVGISKKQQVGEFKQLIAKADLAEMEAMDKERPGLFALMMGMIAEDDPKDFRAEIKDGVATFIKQTNEKTKDLTSTQTTTVTLVREDGRWKFGKPGR